MHVVMKCFFLNPEKIWRSGADLSCRFRDKRTILIPKNDVTKHSAGYVISLRA